VGIRFVRGDRGFTLLEVLLGVTIGLLILTPLTQMLFNSYRDYKYVEKQSDDLYSVQMAYWELIDGRPGDRVGLRLATEYSIRPEGIVFKSRGRYIGYYLSDDKLYRNPDLTGITSDLTEGIVVLDGVKLFSIEDEGENVILVTLETEKNLGVGSVMQTKILLRAAP